MSDIRTPIVAVLGHVDHGKTTILDRIRKTKVAVKEAGGITQHIGATEIPIKLIGEICKDIWRPNIKLPGLLFIDTPGHKAFTNLRKRGGALADLAILVVDINEGIMPQTEEALSILRTFKTPFVVAANKIDKILGWQSAEGSFMKNYAIQDDFAKRNLETKIYELVASFHKFGFNCERFDRIKDFTKTVAIIPVSGITGEGIPELLMVLLGLAQRYLVNTLKLHVEGRAKGTILEIKEERGVGIACDAIIYDGTLKVGDKIVIGGKDDVIVTNVKAILKPPPAREMRVESRFQRVEKISAAAGIKIVATNLEKAIAGSEFEVVKSEEDIERFRERVKKEYEEIAIKTEGEGIILKTDAIGSLEAMINEMRSLQIPIKKAEVGEVDKRDVVEVSTNKDETNKAILAFNIKILPDATEEAEKYGVKIFEGDIIYSIIDSFKKWREEMKLEREKKKIEALIKPGKIKLLKEFIFRRSKPAIIGVRVIGGELKRGALLIKLDGGKVGEVKSIQKEGKNIAIAKFGEEVAIAIDDITIGRQLEGDEVLYVEVPEKHAKVIERELLGSFDEETRRTFLEFLEIKRKENPFWAK
ncbi:MAG: translation initiation factor IF-2 [Archaeoglobaceae archaeon]|nr:translation initiation factor IF-2 [Archaeoglobaceae archaeon]